MTEGDWLAERFEEHRERLRAAAYRMLGSLAEADDAVQEAWIRLSRTGASDVENLGGWLTTVVSRVCLDMLRSRKTRREEPLGPYLPDPAADSEKAPDPEQEVLLADSVGLALQVVLESLTPAERLAFVLHDMFGLPFEEIAPIVDRTPVAAKKLASRARQRVRGAAPSPDPDLAGQRRVVEAFEAASRDGDFEALLTVLDPDVVLRTDGGVLTGGLQIARGATVVARQASAFRRAAATGIVTRSVLVNGAAGVVSTMNGIPFSVLSFTIAHGRIVEIDILSDPDRLSRLDLADFAD